MLSEPAGLRLQGVSFSYFNGFRLHDIDIEVRAGEMVGLLGPNGCGKTTLIRLASGVLSPARGEVWLGGVPLRRLSRKEVARRLTVVPQYFHIPFAFTVDEVVLLGRTPFVSALAGETEEDGAIARRAMELTGVAPLAHRTFNELSGGERQKAILAMALTQQPRVLLLDEPTAHLDINHQVEILGLVRNLNREQGVTVVAAMHDLNLAALYFDRLVLLNNGHVVADGSPAEVLTEVTIREVFGAWVQVEQHPSAPVPHVVVLPRNGDPPPPLPPAS